ncbi:DUF3347 domain-containing protein [Reichenbachiella carrageenanivorans]|uniref:DUF3347 domain-containing protein n=1 Tax=Reichenbachiella carrageenanivorans TaxID=2979869 RepID=A0ABY6CW96_9BACT|nr:DUF3347 domain-containing protein [Reichenbachiella carrageenanivorans]UXX78187.1 DUF3347 domain-containing protein [Reichenbachiella carrageenanivorans]
MKFTYLIIAGLFVSACSSPKESQEEATKEAVVPVATETAADGVQFKSKGIQTIYSAYEKLRDALVATDYETAKTFAAELSKALKTDESTEQQASFADGILNAGEIETARAIFSELNNSMESVFEGSVESGELNQCYCPMALDNTGAFWFSTKKEIENPYFGDKMLKCGMIKKTIK